MASKRKSVPENPPPSDFESSEELTDTEQQNPPRNQSQNPNTADSSDSTGSDDKETSDEEEEEEEEEEEVEQKIEDNRKPSAENTAKPQSDSDSEETGSDTESSDSAISPTASAFKIQPNSDVGKTQKLAQSPNVLTSKSSDENSNANESQKKGKPENGGGEEKKLPFVRIWSDEDELTLLRGMEDFPRKFGRDPYAERDIFLEFIRKSLNFEVTKTQLMEKLRRLKMKYERYAKKGEDPVISKPHELKLFELSKNVWGGANVESSAKAEKRKAVNTDDGDKRHKKVKGNVEVEKSLDYVKENGVNEVLDLGDNLRSDEKSFFDAYPFFKEALENWDYFSKEGMRAIMAELTEIGAAKAKEMEDMWRAFHVKEMELKLFRLEIVEEQTKLVLDALKSLQP